MQDFALLLPHGVPAEEMPGVRLITPDSQYDNDLHDLKLEQRLVLDQTSPKKAGMVSTPPVYGPA